MRHNEMHLNRHVNADVELFRNLLFPLIKVLLNLRRGGELREIKCTSVTYLECLIAEELFLFYLHGNFASQP